MVILNFLGLWVGNEGDVLCGEGLRWPLCGVVEKRPQACELA